MANPENKNRKTNPKAIALIRLGGDQKRQKETERERKRQKATERDRDRKRQNMIKRGKADE